MEYKIRPMCAGEASQAAELDKVCFSEPWSEQGFLDGIRQERNLFLAAVVEEAPTLTDTAGSRIAEWGRPERKGKTHRFAPENTEDAQKRHTLEKIAGYAGMYVAGDEGEITGVAVHPDFRGQGIGKHLLRHLIKVSRERGIVRIVLEVRASNRPAILLYKEAGFSPAGVRKGFYGNPREDAVIMSRFFLT